MQIQIPPVSSVVLRGTSVKKRSGQVRHFDPLKTNQSNEFISHRSKRAFVVEDSNGSCLVVQGPEREQVTTAKQEKSSELICSCGNPENCDKLIHIDPNANSGADVAYTLKTLRDGDTAYIKVKPRVVEVTSRIGEFRPEHLVRIFILPLLIARTCL